MIHQRTIKQPVSVTGIGLHKGSKVTMTLKPAPVNTGIVFRRVDVNPHVDIPARADAVEDTVLCTCVSGPDGYSISTVEHLVSALAGLGVDNIIVEVDANELPIMDGSASPFVFLLQSVGFQAQTSAKKYLRIKRSVTVKDGDKWATLSPYDGFRVDFQIDFDHPAIKRTRQHLVMDFSSQSYIETVSRARTFGFMKDIELMHANNRALGGSMENAVALDESRVLNPEGLRCDDEFLKHKILDAVGDLYLGGYSIIGELKAYKSGHGLNNQLLRAVLEQQDAWEFASFEDDVTPPIEFANPSLAL